MINVHNHTIGRVVGETTASRFQFTVKDGMEPAVFEYIKITVKDEINGERVEKDVLAQVTNIKRNDPAMDGATPIEAVETVSEQGLNNTHTLAEAQVIGYMSNTGVTKPRHAARPGTSVEVAPDKFLEKFVTVDGGLEVGTMLTRESVSADLDVSGLNRHLAILAATGAGKSHTAGVIIEELLDKGGSVLAVDPHGDYVRMTQEKNDGFEHTDRIRVFKARNPGDDEYQIKVKTSNLGWRRICELAGIESSHTNHRNLVKNVVEALEEEAGDYTLTDIVDKLDFIIDNEDEDDDKRNNAEKVQFKLERLDRFDIFGASDIPMDELLNPQQFTVLDLSGVPFQAQDLISYLVLDRVYQARVRDSLGESGETYDYPVFTVIEEAHRLCPARGKNPESKRKISEIAAEGRKFGQFLTLITQRPSKIDEDTLSQCNSMIVQRIVNEQDQNSIAKASESMAGDMISELPSLNVGDAIITGPAVKVPSVVRIRERKTEHGGDDVDISEKLQQARQDAERDENTTSDLVEEDTLDV